MIIESDEADLGGAGLTLPAWFKADDFAVENARLISKSGDAVADDHYWTLSTIDEVAVFRRALSDSEIRDLYNARVAWVRVLS